MSTKNWKYQLVGNFDIFLHAKNQLHPSPLSWYIVKILQTHFGCFEHAWLRPSKTTLPASTKLWYLSWCKKSNLSLNSFLKYWWDIVNFIYWVLWTCLTMPTKNNSINTIVFGGHGKFVGNFDIYLHAKNQLDPSLPVC